MWVLQDKRRLTQYDVIFGDFTNRCLMITFVNLINDPFKYDSVLILFTYIIIFFIELRDAILRRHPEVLDRAISRVESSDYRSELSHSLESAKRLREHLTELDQYRHDILTMDQLTISEIRSYHHPPDGVHEIMMGTYMLLGYEEEKLRVSFFLSR